MKLKWLIAIGLVAVVVAAVCSVVFVDETQTVIVTQFGRPVRTLEEAGLYFKPPYQMTIRLDRRLQVYDPPPSEFLTSEKKNVDLDVFVCWRVANAERFLSSVIDFPGAESRMHDLVFSKLAAEVGSNPLEALVYAQPQTLQTEQLTAALAALARGHGSEVAWRQLAAEGIGNLLESFGPPSPSPHRLDELTAGVAEQCARQAEQAYGIEIVDVRLKRISYPEQVRESVFRRMRAERSRMAKRYRAEGAKEATKIRAAADKQQKIILADAYAEAEITRGEAEAQAVQIYAAAHQRDPEFYKLMRTLEAYRKFLDEKTTILLSADSELLKYLTQGAVVDERPEPEQGGSEGRTKDE